MKRVLIAVMVLLLGGLVSQAERRAPSPEQQAALVLPTLLNGLSSACDHLPMPWTIDLRGGAEGWVWVHPDEKYRSATGTVVASHVATEDFPAEHNSHDQNTKIAVDLDSVHDDLISVLNESSGRVEIGGFGPYPDVIEMEWETGIGTEEKSGDGTVGRLMTGPGPTFPKWAWPNMGDRVWVNGHHVYDCGHGTVVRDLGGFSTTFYRSEIHPARAIASMRDQIMPLPGSGGVPVRVVATDLYIHGDGGMVTDVLNCGTGYIDGGPSDFRCDPPFGDRTPIDENFEFDIHVPVRPFPSAVLDMDIQAGPGNSVWDPNLAPRLTEMLDHVNSMGQADPIIHVMIPLLGSGVKPLDTYARHINVGWLASAPGLRHLRLTPTKMDLHHDKDDPEFDPDATAGDAAFFWLNVDKSRSNEWARLADYDVPTPTDRGLLVVGPTGIVSFRCFAHGRPNVMEDYDADDDGCGSGELNFDGLTFDFYVATGDVVNIRSLGYEQDCYERYFGDHEYHFGGYFDCLFLSNGKADAFNSGLLPFNSTVPAGPLPPLSTSDYDLFFTLEEIALTPAEINDPPVAEANGPYTVGEGSTVTLSSTGSSDPDGSIVLYEWDFAYDGTFDVNAVGASSTFSAALLDGPATTVVALRVTDNFGATAIDTAPLTIVNLPPTATITGDAVGVPGLARSFHVSATDPSLADTLAGFTFNVLFGDGSALVVTPGMPLTLTHVYTNEGDYTIQVTARDKDGGLSAVAMHLVHIQPAALLPDPTHPGATELAAGGTAGNDLVLITTASSTGSVRVWRNGINLGDFSPTGRIVVYAGDGNDDVQVAGGVTIETWLYGGNGNDRLKGGSAVNVLLGEAGDDLLIGGSNRDVMIGGTGADRIVGNGSDDLLIAGVTAFDAEEAALAAILAEWTSARDYATRVANLQGTGSGPRLNGSHFLQTDGPAATVFDDAAADTLTGSADRDWFFANLDGGLLDTISDLDPSELANDLD